MKWLAVLGVFGAGCAESADETDSAAQQAQSPAAPVMTVATAVHHDVSAPLRDAPVMINPPSTRRAEHPIGRIPIKGPDLDDPVIQTQLGPTPLFPTVSPILNFAGVGNGDYGFAPNAAPPDTNGVVGATQYVQWVNESFAVFDKTTGAIAPGFPKAGNTIWAGFGGGCQTNNDGDPVVQYDKQANRWILTQFSVSTTPNLQCVAVSTTPDATGSYARYSFQYANFPDYPKLGVWTDAYYISFNIFTSTFQGALACAYDRTAMLAGAPATQICFQQPTSVASLLPSDLDGLTPPPVGSPNFFVTLQTTTSLNLFKFKVNSFSPASATFTGPTSIPVASFATACRNGGACIPQSGTSQQLDSLSDRAMYRLAYRNIGGHETLLLAHSVSTGRKTPAGVRWYELRSPLTGTFSVFQSGTFAPDTLFRWMPSMAMDKVGNIAVGYSTSSSTTLPGIRAAVRAPTDAAGTLGNEFVIKNGGGSQLTSLNRWGDYSAMTVDPVDDCTLWFTSEYLKANGTFNWSTQIASFKLAGCQ
ncbi:MAG TPA: hypothetical protein VF516_42175 [Kofleriaceae bacterium]